MRKISALVAIAALAAVASSPSPSAAFGLRIGPFHLGIPFFGYRHRHHVPHGLRDEASLKTAPPSQRAAGPQAAPAPSQGLMSPLLYPVLALPAVYDEIFSQSPSAPWPFSYDAILQTAFARTAADQNGPACPQPSRQSAVFERIRAEIRPTGNQLQQSQKLAGALGFAADYLTKACPSEIPQDPAARLQLMEWQVEKLAEALDFVRPPLQELEQSLNDAQRAFLAALPLTHREGHRLYVHANAWAPAHWGYIQGPIEAELSLRRTDARITICGHTHIPAIYGMSPAKPAVGHTPAIGVAVPLLRSRHWLCTIGAVGQPRDGNPAAAYALLDDVSDTLTTVRVPYDVESAAQKIVAAGLPPRLAARLHLGR